MPTLSLHSRRFFSRSAIYFSLLLLLGSWTLALAEGLQHRDARNDLLEGFYDTGTGQFQSLNFVNSAVGWDLFFQAGFLAEGRIIANAEAGHVWDGHEVFLRPAGSPAVVTERITGTGALNEEDFHATQVGHILAGTGYVAGSDPADFTLAGIGMAPMAELWSGAFATGYSTTQAGSFQTDFSALTSVYRTFFEGINGVRPDVINSSWGGGEPSASSAEFLTIDALAAANPNVAMVVSAGNSGTSPVVPPGASFNVITVGSLGGENYLQPSTFSSSGMVDFYNPETEVLHTGVRSAVDLAAPGELFALAAYLGPSGGLGALEGEAEFSGLSDPSPTGQFFINQDGTSFASPLVAGGIALLKDAALNNLFNNLSEVETAMDTRVMKSVLMAGSRETAGWDNGQEVDGDGVIRTTQSLDAKTGAGALDLALAVEIHLLSTNRDLPGIEGGEVGMSGWDFGDVGLGLGNTYFFDQEVNEGASLTASLNWFAGHVYDELEEIGSAISFSDLNLQVWTAEGGELLSLVAESSSTYNNSEFLRIALPMTGYFALRVHFSGLVFDLSQEGVASEEYALAWSMNPVPEPRASFVLLLVALLILATRHRRLRLAAENRCS